MGKPWTVKNDMLTHIVEVFVRPHECNLREVTSHYEAMGLKLEFYSANEEGYNIVFRRDWCG